MLWSSNSTSRTYMRRGTWLTLNEQIDYFIHHPSVTEDDDVQSINLKWDIHYREGERMYSPSQAHPISPNPSSPSFSSTHAQGEHTFNILLCCDIRQDIVHWGTKVVEWKLVTHLHWMGNNVVPLECIACGYTWTVIEFGCILCRALWH